MRKRRIFGSTKQLFKVILPILLVCCPTWALDPDKPVNQYLVTHWETADGIPSNEVTSITQTPDGYLWIATSQGLARFEGIKFSFIPYAEKEKIDPRKTITPITLLVDRAGILWIGSSGALTSYNFQTGQFKTFTSQDGLTKDRIRRIKDDMNGNLWISLWTSYVNRFSDGKFTAFNESHGLKGKKNDVIFEDRKGNLLFGSRENGVFIYKDGEFSRYPLAGLGNHQITAIHEDEKGNLWIGTNHGLFRLTGNITRQYTTGNGLTSDFITSIMEDSDRNLWAGTDIGLNRIKKKPGDEVVFESLLNSNYILCLFEDREKNLWVGTLRSGIKQLKDGKFISYAPLETYPEEIILSVFEDRGGDTWIGTLSGKLFRTRNSEFVESIEPPELSGTGITAIAEDIQGNLWLGTNGKGVLQKKKGTFTCFTTREGLADNQLTSIYSDSQGNLWFCTSDGVSVRRYHSGIIESFNSRDGLPGKKVHNIYEDKAQNIWIAADNGITILEDGKMTGQNMKHYLPGVPVVCIYEEPPAHDGEGSFIWAATHGDGLKRINLKDDKIISYTTDNGMTTDSIFQFFEDNRENFWLMSERGILRVSKVELDRFAAGDPDKINCIAYGISDGMKSQEFNNRLSRHSALKTRDSEFWFITTKGISIVDPEKIRINKTPPPVVIEKVFFDRESISLHQDQQEFKGITYFSFHFTAPTFLSPEKIKFKYLLEGFDGKWMLLTPDKERIADYQNLDPGTYTFKVIACNAEGVWNQTGDSFTFTLKPFFYQTFFFKLAVLLLLLVLAAAAVYIYKKRPFEKIEKYKGSNLEPDFVREKTKKLNHLMEVEKVYRDEKISLQSLAEKLSLHPYQLSQILNEAMNRNFPDFINYYRIEEVKKILATPGGAGKKNTTLAYDVGFNSMTAFYKAFKKFTGKTPNQYKKGSATPPSSRSA